jgi:hypothetical protein
MKILSKFKYFFKKNILNKSILSLDLKSLRKSRLLFLKKKRRYFRISPSSISYKNISMHSNSTYFWNSYKNRKYWRIRKKKHKSLNNRIFKFLKSRLTKRKTRICSYRFRTLGYFLKKI